MEDKLRLVKQLYSFKGYFERFFEIHQKTNTGIEAFEIIEREFYELFGQNKYKDYHSFRVMRKRYIILIQTEAKQNRKIK